MPVIVSHSPNECFTFFARMPCGPIDGSAKILINLIYVEYVVLARRTYVKCLCSLLNVLNCINVSPLQDFELFAVSSCLHEIENKMNVT